MPHSGLLTTVIRQYRVSHTQVVAVEVRPSLLKLCTLFLDMIPVETRTDHK